jgi:hypothetical protein
MVFKYNAAAIRLQMSAAVRGETGVESVFVVAVDMAVLKSNCWLIPSTVENEKRAAEAALFDQ